MAKLAELEARGFLHSADLLGERFSESLRHGLYAARYRALIDALAEADGGRSTESSVGNVSIKLNALAPNLQPAALNDCASTVVDRLLPLLTHARDQRVFINLKRAPKRVVCAMGGKNDVVVDDDADLDEAVAGIIAGG